ncbi:TPA: hypothetical protein ACH3X1_002416 [Trebouxia sp. C0004]
MARTNFANHVATNFFSQTLHWIRLHLKQHIYFAILEYKLVKSWAKFVCRAATEGLNNIWDLLPRYTSLAQPPTATMDYLEHLVATIQSLIGPLPVTDGSLQRQHESYVPWLQMVLLDFHDAQDAPHAQTIHHAAPKQQPHTVHHHKLDITAQAAEGCRCGQIASADLERGDRLQRLHCQSKQLVGAPHRLHPI